MKQSLPVSTQPIERARHPNRNFEIAVLGYQGGSFCFKVSQWSALSNRNSYEQLRRLDLLRCNRGRASEGQIGATA